MKTNTFHIRNESGIWSVSLYPYHGFFETISFVIAKSETIIPIIQAKKVREQCFEQRVDLRGKAVLLVTNLLLSTIVLDFLA